MRRRIRFISLLAADAASLVGSFGLAASMLRLPPAPLAPSAAAAAATAIACLAAMGAYRTMLRYVGLHALVGVCAAAGAATIVSALIDWASSQPAPAAFHVLAALLAVAGCCGSRLLARLYRSMPASAGERIVILGAGSLGEITMRSMVAGGHVVVGLVDDDPRKHGMVIHGRKVLGAIDRLPEVMKARSADFAVLAIRDVPLTRLKRIFDLCMDAAIRVKVVKGIDQLVDEPSDMRLEDLQLEDLLRRPPRNLDRVRVRSMIADQVVLVTGAGGSIGSELCRQIAEMSPRRLLLLDQSEHGLYQIEMAVRDEHPRLEVVPLLASVADRAMLASLLAQHRPQTVFHAAAYKHVPMVEANPYLGIANNVGGTLNLIQEADAVGVERLVLISTDKAVRPTNVMGASKRVCELILQNAPTRRTRLCAVRFGNVLGSSGSVVPRFLAQIAEGGPVTVTHPEITRYFMLVSEAVELVLQAATLANHGEVFILDMGQPVRIADLARQLIFMSGNIPDRDIRIDYTGLRPGEKIYEELLLDESERRTEIDGITVGRPTNVAWDWLEHRVSALLAACARHDLEGVARNLRSLVIEWTPSERYRIAIGESDASLPSHPRGSGDSRRIAAAKA